MFRLECFEILFPQKHTVRYAIFECIFFKAEKALMANFIEPHREKTGILPMQKLRRRSASP